MKTCKYICSMLLLLLSNVLQAQDFQEDMKRMNKAYAELKNFSAEILIKVYAGNSIIPQVTKRATIKKSPAAYYYTLDELTMLMNEDYVLMVNASQKTIAINKRDKSREMESVYQLTAPQVDSLVKQYDEVKLLGTQAGVRHYQVIRHKSAIEKAEIYLDEKTGLIKRLDYWYNPKYQQSRAIILFNNMTTPSEFREEEFSEKKFITREEDAYKPAPDYRGYKIVTSNNGNK